jgi:hypothetical protein
LLFRSKLQIILVFIYSWAQSFLSSYLCSSKSWIQLWRSMNDFAIRSTHIGCRPILKLLSITLLCRLNLLLSGLRAISFSLTLRSFLLVTFFGPYSVIICLLDLLGLHFMRIDKIICFFNCHSLRN